MQSVWIGCQHAANYPTSEDAWDLDHGCRAFLGNQISLQKSVEGLKTNLIIYFPFLFVLQHLIGLIDFLKLFRGCTYKQTPHSYSCHDVALLLAALQPFLGMLHHLLKSSTAKTLPTQGDTNCRSP